VKLTQARLIGTDFAWSYERDSGQKAKVYVTNHSNGPIFNLRACLQSSTGLGAQEPARIGPWSDQITMIDPAGWIEFLLVPSHQPPAPEDGTDATAYEAPKRMFTPRIEFTDADGLRWARVGNGQPHRSVAGSPARRSPQSVRKAAEEPGQR
jgi:hypothetical protein